MRKKTGQPSLVHCGQDSSVCVCVCVFAKYNGKLLKDFQQESTFLFENDDFGKLVRRSLLKFR